MASAGRNLFEQLKQLTKCSICLNTFIDPRVLPCQHTFCLSCLETTVKNRRSGDRIPCPTCRKDFWIPLNGITDVVKNFDLYSILQMLDDAILKSDACYHHTTKLMDAFCNKCQIPVCVLCLTDIHQGHVASDIVMVAKSFSGEVNDYLEQILYYDQQTLKFMEKLDKNRKCYSKEMDLLTNDIERSDGDFGFCEKSATNLLNELLLTKDNHLAELEKERKELVEKQCKMKKLYETYKDATMSSASFVEICQAKKDLPHIIKSLGEWFTATKACFVKEPLEAKIEIKANSETLEPKCPIMGTKMSKADICQAKKDLPHIIKSLGEWFTATKACFVKNPLATKIEIKPNSETLEPKCPIMGTKMYKAVEPQPVMETKVFICGMNEEGCQSVTSEIFEYNPSQPNKISKLRRVPTDLTDLSEKGLKGVAVSFDNSLFLIGIGEGYDQVWKFEQICGWKKCANLDRRIKGHCANIIGGLIYICGGIDPYTPARQKSVNTYDIQSNKCSTAGELVIAVSESTSVVNKDLIYIFGGTVQGGKDCDSVQTFNFRCNTCSLFSKPMPSPQSGLKALLRNNSVILLSCNQCFILDLEKQLWQEREELKTGVYYFGSVQDEDKVYVFGGIDMEKFECTAEVKYILWEDIIHSRNVEWKYYCRLPEPFMIYLNT